MKRELFKHVKYKMETLICTPIRSEWWRYVAQVEQFRKQTKIKWYIQLCWICR